MDNESIGQRVIRLRKHFGIKKQGTLSEELRMSQANVSRVEGDVQIPSNAFLHALKERFAANPHWIMTGEGEMFISPEEFISNGIELLGAKKIGEGFLKLLNVLPSYWLIPLHVAIQRKPFLSCKVQLT